MGLYPLALSSFLAFGWVSSLHTDLRSKVDVRPLKWQEEGDKELVTCACLFACHDKGRDCGWQVWSKKRKNEQGVLSSFLAKNKNILFDIYTYQSTSVQQHCPIL